jgi:hypothetical protein
MCCDVLPAVRPERPVLGVQNVILLEAARQLLESALA